MRFETFSPATRQRLPKALGTLDFLSPGSIQLPRRPQLTLKEALSNGLEMLISAVPHRAPQTTSRSYHHSIALPQLMQWWGVAELS